MTVIAFCNFICKLKRSKTGNMLEEKKRKISKHFSFTSMDFVFLARVQYVRKIRFYARFRRRPQCYDEKF